jgi:hypothetical protein
MALRPEYSLVHSEFNDFLFAFVGEEKSGLQLTVLSALARLGLDPWAVRLLNCLPRRGSPSANSPQRRSIGGQKPKSGAREWLVWIALAAAVFIVISRLYAD